MKKYDHVDDYIHDFPHEVQDILNRIRELVKDKAPEAVESISYGMPAYKVKGKPLIYFGAFKTHIGFYATPSGHIQFANELSVYKQGKGSVQFPLTGDLPYDLIGRMVAYRYKEVTESANAKK